MGELEQQTDPQMAAVAALVRAAVQYDLGKDVLQEVFDHPMTLGDMGGSNVPGMSIYCARSRYVRGASSRFDQMLTVVFDYIMTETKHDLRAQRWPAMRKVWQSMMSALLVGKHDALVDASGNVETPLDVACLDIDRESPGRADFGFVDQHNAHPYFRAIVEFTHYPSEVDATTLDDFLRLHTSFDAPGGDHTEPHLAFTTVLPGFSGS